MTAFLLYTISPVLINIFLVVPITYRFSLPQKKSMKLCLIICGTVMALMIGLRKYSIGSGDGLVYYNYWIRYSELPLSNFFDTLMNATMEKGFLVSIFLLSHLFPNPQFIFIFSGIFTAISVCRFVYYNCESATLPLVLFNSLELFIFMVQGIRQAIAMCICLFAIEACKQKKLIKFIIIISVAMLFHASAFAFLIVYVLYSWEIRPKYFFLFMIGVICAFNFIDYLFVLGNTLIREPYLMEKNAQNGVVQILICVAILIAAYVFKKKWENTQNYQLFFYMVCITCIMFIMRITVSGIIERIGYYFMFGQVALSGIMFEKIDNPKIQLLLKSVTISLCFGVALHKAGYTSLVPYYFFWQ